MDRDVPGPDASAGSTDWRAAEPFASALVVAPLDADGGTDPVAHDEAASVADDAADSADDVDVDVALLDEVERNLADVEVALVRIDDGTYGSCEACGRPIAEAELVRSPAARWCHEHLPLTTP